MLQVWTAASISLLLRARSQAQLRRKEWEEWAVERHGSLQAAYSNPRVKVPKVEELLVEEWGQLKPTQAGMSAYSLHSYLKRFDTLKAELVGAQEEVRRRKEALRAPPPIQYQTLPQSDIPRSAIHFSRTANRLHLFQNVPSIHNSRISINLHKKNLAGTTCPLCQACRSCLQSFAG